MHKNTILPVQKTQFYQKSKYHQVPVVRRDLKSGHRFTSGTSDYNIDLQEKVK